LSDLHLSHGGPASLANDCASLIRARAGSEVVIAGDAFSLSSDPSERDPVESTTSLLASEPNLVRALREHVTGGGKLTMLAGNHDAALISPRARQALLALLELQPNAPFVIEPWFIRRGDVHVEHGHLWDPDNAPAHPLSGWSRRTEPLGIALTRTFVARYGLWQFAHAHETTLAGGMARAVSLYGARAPLLILRYFLRSAALVAESLLERGLGDERANGERRITELAERTGLSSDTLVSLIAAAPPPTHTHFRSVFLRLYYDRVLAALGLGAGLAGIALAATPVSVGLALGSGAYLGWNVRHSGSRYQNMPIRRLREGAEIIRSLTGAALVVFGHTHVPERSPGYANPGSFGYPPPGPGRPFLAIDAHGNPELCRWQSS
jgi:UDP-2,3-diacylglucosamine pyrophosphatase LpxH